MESETRTQEQKRDALKHDMLAKLKTELGDAASLSAIKEFAELQDEEERFAFIQDRIAKERRVGLSFLIYCLSNEETPLFYRSQALDLLRDTTGQDFGYLPESDVAQNQEAITRMQATLLSDLEEAR